MTKYNVFSAKEEQAFKEMIAATKQRIMNREVLDNKCVFLEDFDMNKGALIKEIKRFNQDIDRKARNAEALAKKGPSFALQAAGLRVN